MATAWGPDGLRWSVRAGPWGGRPFFRLQVESFADAIRGEDNSRTRRWLGGYPGSSSYPLISKKFSRIGSPILNMYRGRWNSGNISARPVWRRPTDNRSLPPRPRFPLTAFLPNPDLTAALRGFGFALRVFPGGLPQLKTQKSKPAPSACPRNRLRRAPSCRQSGSDRLAGGPL
jgi:hypothetical protein